MEEKELFEEYEMPGWQLTPRLYKILGIATVANLLILFAFGQFNFLTTRGCDTAYVGMVCQVLDSAYVASAILGKGTEWESRPYEETEIADSDITYIDVSEKLEYPEGYFALANPPEPVDNVAPTTDLATNTSPLNSINTFPTPGQQGSTDSSLMAGTQVTPTPNKNNDDQEIPTSPFEVTRNSPPPPRPPFREPRRPTYVNPPSKPQGSKPLSNESPTSLGGKPKPSPTPTVQKTPQPTPSPTPVDADLATTEFNNKFNKQPLKDFADDVIARIDSPKPEEKVDLKQTFIVNLDGTLTKEGKFDAKKTRFVKGEGNEQMVNVAKKAIEALGDSTIFSYLQGLGVDKLNITLTQDDKQLSAIIRSNQNSESNARSVASGFNLLMSLALKTNAGDAAVEALIKGLKFQPNGKSFVINFAMPKDQAHQLIDQKLQEARQKKLQPNNGEGDKEANGKGQ